MKTTKKRGKPDIRTEPPYALASSIPVVEIRCTDGFVFKQQCETCVITEQGGGIVSILCVKSAAH